MPNDNPPVPGKYIDLLLDFSFKKIFGNDPNKDLLIAFLNEVFRGRKHIMDLVYNKNEHPSDLKNGGAAIFDLLCTGDKGERFLIEVQRGRQGYFKERALFYTSRLISDNAPKGNRKAWDYNIPEVYFVAVLEDFSLGNNTPGIYINDICLCSRDTGKIFYDKLGYTFIELINFVKTETELETELDKWLFILKNISQMDKIPAYLRKPIFEKLFNIAEYTNLSKEEKEMYDSNLKYKWDNKNVLDYAVKEAVKEAVEVAVKEASEKADSKARKEEQAKALENTKAIAREMKKDGLPFSQISKFTKLSVEEIEKL